MDAARSAGFGSISFDLIYGLPGQASAEWGDTLREALSLEPDIVILETGANDGLRGLDPGLLRTNLDRLVNTLTARNIQVIMAGMLMLPNLGPDYTRAFSEIYPQIAEKHGVLFIPFFLDGVAGKRDPVQSSGELSMVAGHHQQTVAVLVNLDLRDVILVEQHRGDA